MSWIQGLLNVRGKYNIKAMAACGVHRFRWNLIVYPIYAQFELRLILQHLCSMRNYAPFQRLGALAAYDERRIGSPKPILTVLPNPPYPPNHGGLDWSSIELPYPLPP